MRMRYQIDRNAQRSAEDKLKLSPTKVCEASLNNPMKTTKVHMT